MIKSWAYTMELHELQKLKEAKKAKALENEKIANEARIKAQEEALARLLSQYPKDLIKKYINHGYANSKS